MKTIPGLRLLTLAGFGSLMCVPALAQMEGGNTYLGLSAGRSTSSFDEQRMANSLLGAGVSSSSLSSDTRGNAYRFFGGYQLNRSLAIEAGYFNLGRFGFSSTTAPAGTLDGGIKVHGFNLDLVGTLPVTDRLSALARVGAQYAKTRDRFSATGAAAPVGASSNENGTGAKLGLGLQYALSPSLLIRGEIERYRIADGLGGKGNVNAAMIGLVVPFGRSAAPAARPVSYVAPAPAPAPIVMAPPPPPEVIVVAAAPPVAPVVVPPAPRRVSFSAESLFAFDNSALRPEGRAALDTFSKDLAGSQYQVVNVEGHTDRIGSPAYNQRLSLQRADAVKGYLVSAGQIDPAKVSAQGKGETQPVTKAEDCQGNTANAKLIACLQPDRRVDIEVVGTR